MTELCKFYKNGNIIYKNINLIDLASTSIFIDITNSEIINSKDVYKINQQILIIINFNMVVVIHFWNGSNLKIVIGNGINPI